MRIEAFLDSDLDSLVHLQPDDWSPIHIPITYYLSSTFCYPFKCMIEDRMVGVGTAILHENIGWLSTIVTHTDFRGQGIGSVITRHLLDFLQSHHCKHIALIATHLGEPVYHKAGFRTHSKYVFFKNVVLDALFSDGHIVDFEKRFKDQVIEMDKKISGEDRSQHLLSFIDTCKLYTNEEVVLGAYFPHWGDGLIIADSPAAGNTLLRYRLNTFTFASFPEENVEAVNYIISLGEFEKTYYARMYYGQTFDWKPTSIYHRIGGKIG